MNQLMVEKRKHRKIREAGIKIRTGAILEDCRYTPAYIFPSSCLSNSSSKE